MDDIIQKDIKSYKDPSQGMNKREIWQRHLGNLELLALKRTKLITFL